MSIGFIFWLLMILWVIFGFLGVTVIDGPYRSRILGGWGLLTFVLFFLLGWGVFGFVIQGPGAPMR